MVRRRRSPARDEEAVPSGRPCRAPRRRQRLWLADVRPDSLFTSRFRVVTQTYPSPGPESRRNRLATARATELLIQEQRLMSTTCNETSARRRNNRIFGVVPERLLRVFALVARAMASRYARIHETALLWIERDRQRRDLQELSDHMLQDIGMSRCDVYREASKKVWHE
jgi:uncharacterized protein YjiS (DUF1127 family)